MSAPEDLSETAPPPAPSVRRWTLARRIAVLALAPAALALVGGSIWLRTQMHGALYQSFAQALQERQERVAARLLHVPGVKDEVTESGAGDEFSTIYSGWYWQVRRTSDASTLGHSRSLWDAEAQLLDKAAGPAALGLMQARGPRAEPLLAQSRSITLSGLNEPATLTVFAPASALQDNLERIDRILLVSVISLIVFLTVMLLAQVRVGLAPLRRLTRAVAAERQPHGPRHPQMPRIQDVPAGSDLAPLQRELGALLAHNERVVSRARAHAADLNHALKKPLALLAASASRQSQVDSAEALQHITAMTRLIDRYQSRTMSDAAHASATHASTAVLECLTPIVQAMRRLHAAQELDWHMDAPPPAAAWRWRGDRTDLEEATGNLLDNAGKWAASQVRLQVRRTGSALRLSIEDDGPGMSAVQLEAAGQRGLRFDESVEGTGLGLSIASQIAQAYGGELKLGKSEALKGLRVELTLEGLI